MEFRNRRNEERDRQGGGPPEDGAGADERSLADQGADFFAAGEAAIEAALSGDSQLFLEDNRQDGGQ